MISLTATELPRFMACNGSILMGKIPQFEADTTITEEGNAAHWLIEQVFTGNYQLAEELTDRKAPNGVFITAEMVEHTKAYLSEIMGKGQVEIDTSYSSAGKWEVRGRADHIYYEAATSVLYVRDFKYGWKIVEPHDNWTLIWHAIGWMIKNPGVMLGDVVFQIYQPRPFHPLGYVRECRVPAFQVTGFSELLISVLENPKNTVTTGPHCYKCPSMAICPAAQMAVANAIEISERAYDSSMSDIDLSLLISQTDRAMTHLKQFNDACSDLAKHRIKAGALVPGYGLEQSYGHKTWKSGLTPDVVKMLVGADVSKPALLTPAQAKKAGASEDAVEALCDRPNTGVKLVRVNESKRYEKFLGKKEK